MCFAPSADVSVILLAFTAGARAGDVAASVGAVGVVTVVTALAVVRVRGQMKSVVLQETLLH